MKMKEGIGWKACYNDEKGVKFGGQVVKIDKTTKEVTFKNYRVSYENNKVEETEGWAK